VSRHLARELALLAVLALVAAVLALAAPGFFAPGNLRNLALDNLPLLLAATGMTLVIVAGEIDVSIGAQFAAAGVAAGVLAKLGLSMALVVPLVVALGALLGAGQGALVARGVPAVVVTLASLASLRGVLRWSTGGRWISELPAGFQWLGLGQARGQLAFACAALLLVGLTALALRWLHLGRTVYAVGCDASAARLAGIRTARVRIAVFAAMGAFAAAAAVLSAARYPAIEIEAGAGLELQAIACVVLGGASIRGGRGTLLGTALGVVLFGTLGTALVFLGVGAAWERAVQGAIILAAVLPELWRTRERRAHAWHLDAGRERVGPRRTLVAVLALEVAAFALLSDRFASTANALEVVRATAELGLLALASLVVLKSGGIDLSVGAMMGLAAVTLGASHAAGAPIAASVALALAVGAAGGALNGALVAAGVPSFLTTLATLALFRGLAEGWTGGYAVYSRFPPGFLELGQGYLFGFLPPQALLLAAAALLAWVALHRAAFGRRVEAVGYAPGAARHAGVAVARLQVLAFTLAGLAAALAGVVYVAHLGQARADAGSGWELAAITVAVLGGTSIRGGAGRVEGTVLALLCIGVLQNGLLVTGSPSELAAVLLGCLLVGTVLARHGPHALAAPTSGAASSSSLRMKNSQVAVIVAAILAGALIIAASNAWMVRSLANGGSGASLGAKSSTRVQVALMPKNKSDPYFASCKQGAEEAAHELGVELLWEGPNDTDAARQNEIVEAWITRGVDVIGVSVENAASISTVLRKARARGIRVLAWDADAEPDARDFFVNQATAEGIGFGLADEAARLLGGQGSFAIVTATLTAANQNAWIEHIRGRLASRHPGLSIAVIRPSDGLRDKALTETKAILRAHPGVKLVMVIAAAAVPGAAEAVKQEGSDARVIGLSVPSLCRAYVHEGIVASILLWNTVDLGYLTVHAADALARGTLRPGSSSFTAGRLGALEVRGDNVLLGVPFRFDASNIDRFEF
jgi:rhamnose transport system permease protein